MQDNKLDFAVIGAQKCATSWMFYCLTEHPELLLPDKKQEVAYIGGEAFLANGGARWFFDRYSESNSAKLRGDVSVDYLYDRSASNALRPYISEQGPKLIVSLRHPVDRLISSYYWLVRRGQLDDLPLEEGLAPLLKQDLGFPAPLTGGLEEIVRRGCYSGQLQLYVDMYGADSMCAVLYEDISRDGLNSIQGIYRFLGVDDSFVPPSLGIKPKKNTYNKWALKFERLFNNKYGAKIANIVNQCMATVSDSKPTLSKEARLQLVELYRPHIESTKALLLQLPEAQRPASSAIDDLWND